MLDKLNKLLRYGKAKSDFLEINAGLSKEKSFFIENNKLSSSSYSDILSVSARAWINGKLGISNSNNLDKNVVDSAIESAKNSEKKEFFYGLPKNHKYPNLKGIYDKNIEEIAEKELSEIVKLFLNNFNKQTYISDGGVNLGVYDCFFVNSEGIEAREKSTKFGFGASCVAVENGIKVSMHNSLNSRAMVSLDKIQEFSKSLSEETRFLLNSKKLNNFKIPEIIILEKGALNNLLDDSFLSNFSAELLIKGNSILEEKQDKVIANPKFNLIDDGLLTGGFGSSTFDDEGVSCRTNKLIENGIMKNFIYNYNTAMHLKKEPSGNAHSDGIGFNNILIEKGNKDILSEFDEAIIIDEVLGSHTANSFTTDFSVNPIVSFYLKKGKKIPIKDFMISGNFLNMLKNIELIDNKIINIENFYTPAIAFNNINLSVC